MEYEFHIRSGAGSGGWGRDWGRIILLRIVSMHWSFLHLPDLLVGQRKKIHVNHFLLPQKQQEFLYVIT